MTQTRRMWGRTVGLVDHAPWIDLLIAVFLAGCVFGVVGLAREWGHELRPEVAIDLSARALPGYALYSLARGAIAFALSIAFTLGYGYWAAHDRRAAMVLIPLLDVLQSLPVLGFMPGLVIALIGLFPHSNVGLELAAIGMIFTGQVWNMTFSFYRSLRSVPPDLEDAASMFRFSRWERLRWLELPSAAIGLVWNSMISVAGGWFFLMLSESFVLGAHDFRLPGLGSFMTVAVARGDVAAMLWAVAVMIVMIVVLDQLVWRPLVAWAQKFRIDDSGHAAPATSWFLDLLVRSHLVAWVRARRQARARGRRIAPRPARGGHGVASTVCFVVLLGVLGVGALRLVELVAPTTIGEWTAALGAGGATLARVVIATALGTLGTVPVGLAIGSSPRLQRIAQPIVQIAASFPAPMLFPALIVALHAIGVPLGWGSIVLMLVGTQWYILFNVVAGAAAIPADLREASRMLRLSRWETLRSLELPAIFPYLVTGWVTAAGAAWNTSIVAEYVSFRGHASATYGLGAAVSEAAARGQFAQLAACLIVMSGIVVVFHRAVWRRLHELAEHRCSLVR